ncbi:MAG TPA: hypothetical protein VKQ10_03270 [Spirochaetota bacterium]|nr:hypothetical protein [Spirochaetota bacterium]
MYEHDSTVVDMGVYSKLRDIEKNLKNEMEDNKNEILHEMNKKEEYLVHIIRVLLAKIDSMENPDKFRVIDDKKPQDMTTKPKKKKIFFGL